MTGYQVNITENKGVDLSDYNFMLYDNDELVVPEADATFTYLIDETAGAYEGVHTLELAYNLKSLPAKQSAKTQIYQANFTLPALDLAVTVIVI